MQAAGKRNRRVTILAYAGVTTNDLGEPEETWTPGLTISAERHDVLDGEKATAGANVATRRVRFLVLNSSISRAVGPKDRLSCRDKGAALPRIYAVVGIKEVDNGDGIEWTADGRAEG